MSRDHQDILLDQMLREMLGGDRPRDLTERIMCRARAQDRTRRGWWAGGVSAVAACIVIAITLWMVWPRAYPGPRIEEGTAFTDNGNIERGTRVATDEEQKATLSLGNYVKLNMEPLTSLTIGGSKFAEKVFLEQGELNVDVTKDKGKFDLAVGPLVVQVTGTRFVARIKDEVLENQGGGGRFVKRLLVSVQDGSVMVHGAGGAATRLAAGSTVAEGTFEISSELRRVERATMPISPTPPAATETTVIRPRTPETKPATASPETRVATRMPSVLPPPSTTAHPPETRASAATHAAATTAPGRSGTIQFTPLPQRPAAGLDKPVMVLMPGRGRVERDGILRRPNDIYFLETANALVLMYPQVAAPSNLPERGSYVHVVFEGGRAISVDPIKRAVPAGRAGPRG